MRVFVLWPYYPKYLDSFFAARPELAQRDSASQLSELLADYFTWPVYVPLRMGEQGHTVEVCIANAPTIGRAWARENGFAIPESDAEFAVVLERVRRFQPDVLYMGPMFNYYGARLAALRPHCRRIVSW